MVLWFADRVQSGADINETLTDENYIRTPKDKV